MRQFRLLARRPMRLLPAVTAALLLAGCDSNSSRTAQFPDMGKAPLKTEMPKKPAKGMDRAGSDAVKPL